MTIAGYPAVVNDLFDDGTGDAEISAGFGNWRRGMLMAESDDLVIAEKYMETRPGACTFFSQGRVDAVVQDALGLNGLSSNA